MTQERLITVRNTPKADQPRLVQRVPIRLAAALIFSGEWCYTTKAVWKRIKHAAERKKQS